MKSVRIDTTNGLCGALLIVFGLFFAFQSLSMDLGTALRMGPGYFPLVLSGILVLVGIGLFVWLAVSVVRRRRRKRERAASDTAQLFG